MVCPLGMRSAAISLAVLVALALSAPAGARKHDRWHRGQCSSPERERMFVAPEQQSVHVTAAMLVDARDLVAGADPLRAAKFRSPAEKFLVTAEVAAALVELRQEVKAEFGPEYDIWLNGAWDSSGRARRHHSSMHLSGRAVDLDLYVLPHGKHRGGKANGMVHEFAPVVARVFSRQHARDGRLLRAWVLDEGNHVHASLESPSIEDRLLALLSAHVE